MNSRQAPLALFCFNRPQHLLRTIESLKACAGFDRSGLYVYADGPRHAADVPGVEAVRELLARHLPNAAIVERPSNIGLAANIIDGVTTLCNLHGRVIVLEDDLLLDPRFLTFMNQSLDQYERQVNVYAVAGRISAALELDGRREAVMLPWPSSWGWATWKRAWRCFDPEANGWRQLARDRKLRRRFNLRNTIDYTTMLERQMHGLIQSWAVRWYWSMFRADALTVYPPFNLVDNIGFDGTGTHGRGQLRRFGRPTLHQVPSGSIALPDVAEYDEKVFRQVLGELWVDNGGWVGHSVDRVKRILWRVSCRLRGSS